MLERLWGKLTALVAYGFKEKQKMQVQDEPRNSIDA